MNKILMLVGVLVGLLFLAIAAVYFFSPASHLPGWMPGYDVGSDKIHFKHGIGALFLGIAAFVFAWFQTGPGYSLAEASENIDENQ